ncbi:MAG: hypothetical protein N2485_08360, partial [bacterium]|nr:hypothetical protein [bacterium]
ALYYLLLPITEYGEKLFSNGPRLVSNIEDYKQTGGISLLTLENNPAENKGGGLVFAFDKNFNCIYISTNTFYSENYNKFFDAGLVKEKLTFEKLQNFRNKILFWDGEKFVYEPTMNKYHNQKFIDAKGNEIKLNVNNIL